MRCAAFPVGAASATSSGCPASIAIWCATARNRATVRVLPVPGPPAITTRRRVSAASAATRWRSGGPSGTRTEELVEERHPEPTTVRHPPRRIRRARGGRSRPSARAPVPLEVHAGPVEHERPDRSPGSAARAADRRARPQRLDPRGRARATGDRATDTRRRLSIGVATVVDDERARDVGEHDADVTEPRRAHREGDGEQRRDRRRRGRCGRRPP